MHIYFSGIGGTGIGPLALIANQAGFEVSGSDKQDSRYIEYLKEHGIKNIAITQSYEHIAEVHAHHPIDWFVYTSALPIENPDAPELRFCREHHIRTSKRDEFLSTLIEEKNLKLIAIAGTHGKTTTTAMTVWLFKQLGIPISYSVGAKISFGEMGQFDPDSKYFIYEADEYDRNFLSFHPYLSIITGIDWDHPDIYPTRESYNSAFREFLSQSDWSVVWQQDLARLGVTAADNYLVLNQQDKLISQVLTLPGIVNRQNAWQVANAVQSITNEPLGHLYEYLNLFPGVSRRFEQVVPYLHSDYAHTPPKIRGALQMAHEVAGDNVVVIYEGLHNTRQHFIKDELMHLFDDVEHLYIVPSYLAREDKTLPLLSPADLKALLSPKAQEHTTTAELNSELIDKIRLHFAQGDLVLCLSAGGGNSLDEWVRKELAAYPSKEAPK